MLPDIIVKVLEAKKLRMTGKAKSSSQACRAVGISRSAYYKYKDCVFAYDEKIRNRIVSFYLILRDEKGILSSVLSGLYALGANILTVNQNLPVDAVASVTVTAKFERDCAAQTEFAGATVLGRLKEIDGVVEAKIISEE